MGNKISIKDRFESFTTIQSPEKVVSSLKEIFSQKITDNQVKLGISPQKIRQYIEENLEGFKLTLTECVNHLFCVTGTDKVFNEADVTYSNNVLMLLTRFLPVLHEEKYKQLANQLLWTKNTFPSEIANQMKHGPYVMEECLAIKLMNSLFQLMFYPEYTISAKKVPEPKRLKVVQADLRFLWKSFDNFRNENDNIKYHYNRVKVLECLLACFSAPLLNPLNIKQRSGDPWIYFCISIRNTLLPIAILSMLNFGLSYEENGAIPYTQYITGNATGEKLAVLCLQIICLFADIRIDDSMLYHQVLEDQQYQQIVEHYVKLRDQKISVDSYEIKLTERIKNTQTCREILQNGCLLFLTELKLTECYDFISNHVLRVIRNPYEVENTYLLESRKKTILLEETLLVFWRVLENNKTFVQRIYYHPTFLQIIMHLIYQIHESFTFAAKSSVFYIAVIILSKLSCDRTFSIQLKRKYMNDIGFTRIPIFIGNYMDLLFIVFLNGMVDSYVNGYFCYQNNLLAILHNVAPFAKDLCSVTASLLIQLVKAVANPKVIRFDKNNLLILRKALNLVHKIICYQPETCLNLLYELIFQKKDLEYLKQLPLRKIFGIRSKKIIKQDQKPTGSEDAVQKIEDNKNKNKSEVESQNRDLEEEKKVEPQIKSKEKIELPIQEKKESPSKSMNQTPIQLFDDRWMELYENNMANDLIFLVTDYLQEQLRLIYRERNSNSEEELKAYLQEQSILGVVPQPGPIMIEVVNDPENINNNLFLFLWHQIFLKSNGMPHFDTQDAKLLNINQTN